MRLEITQVGRVQVVMGGPLLALAMTCTQLTLSGVIGEGHIYNGSRCLCMNRCIGTFALQWQHGHTIGSAHPRLTSHSVALMPF